MIIIKNAAGKQYLVSVTAANSEKVLTSETYKTKTGCIRGIKAAAKNFADHGTAQVYDFTKKVQTIKTITW